jgi:Raf kinase inhibitor-like YbhB/YbcL family protein
MRIHSPDFEPGQLIPPQYTCQGDNINPTLVFEAVPANTASFALIVEDIDSGEKPWVHWLVFNIPPEMLGIARGSVPPLAIEGLANGGDPGYEGPCPKYFTGTHHYRFSLYALDTMLDIPAESDAAHVRSAMNGHIVAEAQLEGTAEGTKT